MSTNLAINKFFCYNQNNSGGSFVIDRWDRAYGPGDDSPNIYGEDPAKYDDIFAKKGKPYCHIYYLDGLIKTYKK